MANLGAAKPKCKVCKKVIKSTCKAQNKGSIAGNGTTLGNAILKNFKGKNKSIEKFDHPFYTGSASIQAHHVLCTESFNKDATTWKNIADFCGFDINHQLNGIFLPYKLKAACHLEVPLHRGNHADTEVPGFENYVKAVDKKLENLKQDIEEEDFCQKNCQSNLLSDLNDLADEILGYISLFDWTISMDGKHYIKGDKIGCSNVNGIGAKRDLKGLYTPCDKARFHLVRGSYLTDEPKIKKTNTLYDTASHRLYKLEKWNSKAKPLKIGS